MTENTDVETVPEGIDLQKWGSVPSVISGTFQEVHVDAKKIKVGRQYRYKALFKGEAHFPEHARVTVREIVQKFFGSKPGYSVTDEGGTNRMVRSSELLDLPKYGIAE